MNRTLKIRIRSSRISGSFSLTFEPYIVYEIDQKIDAFMTVNKKKIRKQHLHIDRTKDGYEVNPRGFIAIINIIYSDVLKHLN